MSEWSPPAGATPQDYPKQSRPGSGSDDLIARFRAFQVEVRDKFNNLLKQAGIRARPGMVTSLDFDGDGGRVDLGTQGWMLGAVDGGPSFLVLNGVDVYASLSAQIAAIAALVGAQVNGDTGTATTGGTPADLAASLTDYAVITFTVPSGYTRAVVLGDTTITSSGGDAVMSTSISASVGMLARCYADSFGFGNGATSHAATLTGLSGGGTFTVRSTCARTGAATTALISTSASVMYLK